MGSLHVMSFSIWLDRSRYHAMTPRDPTAALRQFDRLAYSQAADRAAWSARMRQFFLNQRSPLARAQYILRAASVGTASVHAPGHADELLLALRTFQVNDVHNEVNQCLGLLAFWWNVRGLDHSAIEASHMALARTGLSVVDRARLMRVISEALASQRLLPLAWRLADEVLASERKFSRSPAEVAAMAQVRAHLHFVEAVRARRVPSTYTIDLPADEPDRLGYEQHALACEQQLRICRESGTPRPDVHGQLQALLGDEQGMQHQMALVETGAVGSLASMTHQFNWAWCWRVLGQTGKAGGMLSALRDALPAAEQSRLRSFVLFESSLCAQAAGDAPAALAWLMQFNRWTAETSMLDQQTLRQLKGPALGASRSPATASGPTLLATRPSAPAAEPELRSTEPALLKHAEQLYLSRLPRRVSLQSLAEELGVTIRTLQLASRRHRHCTLLQMLRREVMNEALALVQHSDESFAGIAARLGYRDATAFSRDFAKVHGRSPRHCRGLASAQAIGAAPVLTR